MNAQLVALLQQEGPGFEFWPGVFLHRVYMFSPRMGYLQVAWLPPKVQKANKQTKKLSDFFSPPIVNFSKK